MTSHSVMTRRWVPRLIVRPPTRTDGAVPSSPLRPCPIRPCLSPPTCVNWSDTFAAVAGFAGGTLTIAAAGHAGAVPEQLVVGASRAHTARGGVVADGTVITSHSSVALAGISGCVGAVGAGEGGTALPTVCKQDIARRHHRDGGGGGHGECMLFSARVAIGL